MITAYMYGKDIGWLLTLFVLFLFVGGAIALVMINLTESYKLFSYRDNIFFISALISIFSLIGLVAFTPQTFSLDELETGRNWKKDCKLIEVTIPTGTFTDSVNKLDCAGVIINVPVKTFNTYTSQWEMYKDGNK